MNSMQGGMGTVKQVSSVFTVQHNSPVPEIIDPVFAKTSQYARFLLSENERFGLVLVKTGSINSGTEAEIMNVRFR